MGRTTGSTDGGPRIPDSEVARLKEAYDVLYEAAMDKGDMDAAHRIFNKKALLRAAQFGNSAAVSAAATTYEKLYGRRARGKLPASLPQREDKVDGARA